jgi:hypothetical protein
VGKLLPFPLGISELEETCVFGKRKSKDTMVFIFKLKGAEIS